MKKLIALLIVTAILLTACTNTNTIDDIDIFKTKLTENYVETVEIIEKVNINSFNSIESSNWQIAYFDYLKNFNYSTVRCAYVEDINRDGIPEIVFGIFGEYSEYFISYYSAGKIKELRGIEAGAWDTGIYYNEYSGVLMNIYGGTHVFYTFYDYIDGNYEKTHDLIIWHKYIATHEPDFYAEDAVRVETWYWYYNIDGVDSEGFIESVYSDLVELEYGNDLFNESLRNILGFEVNGFDIKGFEEVINFSEYDGTEFIHLSEENDKLISYIEKKFAEFK